MKSKKTSNTSTNLSPANYIRLKSRDLPIIKCLISDDWKEAKICNLYVIRQHANGNVTFCAYLVDLACLGVKNTFYQFNLPFETINEMVRKGKDHGVFLVEIPYELAHNIIYAAITFADDFGFRPCDEFTSITEFFLDDTDDIPYIDIACGGHDGEPIFINTGFDSPDREKQIIAQLKKTTGKGNFMSMRNIDDGDMI